MPEIRDVRPVLLSVPYGDEDSFITEQYLKNGKRTCGMVTITLDDGITGIGEGYVSKFAPDVFESIADLLGAELVGSEATDIHRRYREMCDLTDYWSRQGAARQVISALEIALVDAVSKSVGVPAYEFLGGARVDALRPYGSGGEGMTKEKMVAELERLDDLGVDVFKIRSTVLEVAKTSWVLDRAAEREMRVAVDLMTTGRSVKEIFKFVQTVRKESSGELAFLEEPLDREALEDYGELRSRLDIEVTGGEAVTTVDELHDRVSERTYDFVQPDATVIGGMYPLFESFSACRRFNTDLVVHCWGGPACLMANYHAAFAGGGRLVEWPMPAYPLREEMMLDPLTIENGRLEPPSTLGLGVRLTGEIETAYPYDENAVFRSPERRTESGVTPHSDGYDWKWKQS